MAVSDAQVTKEKQTKNEQTTDWHPFFKHSDNKFINDLATRARRSPTHGAIVQSKAIYTSGQGFTYWKEDEQLAEDKLDSGLFDFLKSINSKGQSYHWLFSKGAYDYTYSGNHYIEVIKGDSGTYPFYLDASKVRVSDDKAFISVYWREIMNNSAYNKEDYPVKTIELWNGKIDTKQKHFIIHVKNQVPEYDYYGLPEHLQVLKWADIEYKMVTYNLDKLKNGFFPSAAMTVVGNPPEGMTGQEYIEKIVSKFTDEGNNSKIFAQLVDDISQETKVTEFTGASEGELLNLGNMARDMIVAGHRWFPSLSGIQTAGSLGSNQQIRNEYNIALKGVIIPQLQRPLLKCYNDLLKICGYTEIELDIMNVAPVGIEDKIQPKDVLTKDEMRELLGYEPLTDEQKAEAEANKPDLTPKKEEDGTND